MKTPFLSTSLSLRLHDISDSAKTRCQSMSGKSTLEPVDEEPHSLTEIKQKQTVDRGVGPTPTPQESTADKRHGLTLDGKKPNLPPHFPITSSPIEQSAYQQCKYCYYISTSRWYITQIFGVMVAYFTPRHSNTSISQF